VLAEEKLYAICARLETSVRKFPKRLTQQTSLSNTSARRNTKFDICSSVHRNSSLKKSNKMRQYADIYLLLNYSTCFGRPIASIIRKIILSGKLASQIV